LKSEFAKVGNFVSISQLMIVVHLFVPTKGVVLHVKDRHAYILFIRDMVQEEKVNQARYFVT